MVRGVQNRVRALAVVTLRGYTLTFARETVDVSTRGHHELDPAWSYTDPAGHVHIAIDSLEWIVTGTYWCEECRDEHEAGEYRCRLCGAVVEPRWVWKDTAGIAQYAPGLLLVTLTTEDGRIFVLSSDEIAAISADGSLAPGLYDRIIAREPDSWAAR